MRVRFCLTKRPTSDASPFPLFAGAGIPVVLLALALVAPGCGSGKGSLPSRGIPESATTDLTQVTRGRYLVTTSGCTDCHNRGVNNPSDAHWMAGYLPGTPGQPFDIGPFKTYPANLTSDTTTGIGQYTDRQVYNALKFGLDPGETPNVTITGTTPGVGNFPANPHYLAPPMPWPATRHMTDDDLWAMVAYLKHGTKPVNNNVPDSTGPPDNWASSYTDAAVGPKTLPDFPAGNEQLSL